MPTKTKAKTTPQQWQPLYDAPTWVDRTHIDLDAGTQTRPGGTDPKLVSDYKESRENSFWTWLDKPAVLFRDKRDSENPIDWKYYPGDGHHRIAGEDEMVYATIYEGDARTARYYSLTEANKDHGMSLTKDDRKHHAAELLRDTEWGAMSSQVIAEKVGLSRPTVESIRAQLEESGEIQATTERKGKDGKTRKVEKSTPCPFEIGDWLQGPIVESGGKGTAEGYLKSIGDKYLRVINNGREFGLLAKEAKRLWSPSPELREQAALFGLPRHLQIERLLTKDWATCEGKATDDSIVEDYKGWEIVYDIRVSENVYQLTL